MMYFTKFLGTVAAIALMATAASAAETVSAGKIKSIDADAKSFVLTDSANKDFTFKIGDNVVVNRAGTEGKSDLKAGDAISVSYDKGILNWTADYILVQEGKTKNCELVRGTVKSYDAAKKELDFTNEDKKDVNYAVGDATVRIDMKDANMDSVKIGDRALLIVHTVDGKSSLKSVMVCEKK